MSTARLRRVARGIRASSGARSPLKIGLRPDARRSPMSLSQIVDSGAEAVAMITFAEGARSCSDLPAPDSRARSMLRTGSRTTYGGLSRWKRRPAHGLRGTAPSSSPANGTTRTSPLASRLRTGHADDLLGPLLRLPDGSPCSPPRRPRATIRPCSCTNMITVTRDGEKCTDFARASTSAERGHGHRLRRCLWSAGLRSQR